MCYRWEFKPKPTRRNEQHAIARVPSRESVRSEECSKRNNCANYFCVGPSGYGHKISSGARVFDQSDGYVHATASRVS